MATTILRLPSVKARTGPAQWFAEVIATAGLVMVILGGLRVNAALIPAMVGLYIMAALWFTASTSFANPAVTLGRTVSDTFAGIDPADAPAFIAFQVVGALIGWLAVRTLYPVDRSA